MAGKGWPHGKALSADKKTIRYFSPSALMAADPGTTEGCLRRYYYEYVMGKKPEQQTWQTTGIELHAQNEHYLLTGEKNMGSLALSGLHMLPKPYTIDPRIMVEHEIAGDLATAPLRAAGIPVAGYIDAIHWQGTNSGSSDVMDTIDPEGTVEVCDWKTTSSDKWIKTPQEMARTLQMTIYGRWALVTRKAEWVRLSHGYYITKGRHLPRKVSLRVHRDQIDERWEYVEGLASSLVEVVKEDNPDNVPANTKACGAFRGCPHASYCTAAQHNSLSSLIGSDFAASLLGLNTPEVLTPNSIFSTLSGNQPMSLLAKLQATQTPAPTIKPEVQLEMQRLELEEISAKYPRIGYVIRDLEALGMGLPVLEGEAARVYKILIGMPPVASGELGGFTFEDPNQLAAVLAEAQAILVSRAEPVVPVVSPFPEDAPPALASPPEDKKPEPITNAVEAIEAAAGEVKKGRKKKDKVADLPPRMELPAEAVVPTYVTTNIVNNYTNPLDLLGESATVNLYVDCIPSCEYQSFWPTVNKVTDAMVAKYGIDYKNPLDDKHACSYGKWRSYLAAGVQHLAKELAPGNYLLDGATEIGAVVIEAMRDAVTKSGGVIVRGIR
jgi:hypothetical protein